MRFEIRGKISPRFVGPYEILEKIGKVAYRLVLPPSLSRVHSVIHVSMLRKYIPDPNHVIELEALNLREDLPFEEQPIRIVDHKNQVLRRINISYVKVQWQNHSEREATWELEEKMRLKCPFLFENSGLDPRELCAFVRLVLQVYGVAMSYAQGGGLGRDSITIRE
ncbi:uncharacterized protein LOC143857039 [Tasmannia lanceolata]|uniref:uncharacterized protein LOC143857039 n=1 Tax=Tasmannia lanceolata TaxID=3420 RepID=UPI004064A140